MPPKKKGKGKKKKEPGTDPGLTEVDKTFYELTIADLNRKLARLRSLTAELEESNESLQQQLTKVDEDRNDIIMYLKRVLQEKIDEIKELEERLKGTEESMQVSSENYKQQIVEMNAEYEQMHDQLTSEIKLFEGKLNALEEFRIQRDELLKKFEVQEMTMEEQEKRHFRELYEIERKFIIKKDQLKKDMEAKLLELSSQFQDATELRIAATTHRVIRENISINNELDVLLATQQHLFDENNALKKKDTNFKQQIELLESEKKCALGKVRVQLKIIGRLTSDHKFMMEQVRKFKRYEQEIHASRNEVKDIADKNKALEYKVKILEQNLHNVRCNRTSIQTDYLYLRDENERLTGILLEAVSCIRDTMTMGAESDMSLKSAKRENLLSTLFTLLNTAKEERIKRPSLETIDSVMDTYARGDLGFVPKVVELRSKVPTMKHTECQTTGSLERFIPDEERHKRSIISYDEEGEMWEEEQLEERLPSLLFFDESEIVGEEQSLGSEFDIFAAMQEKSDAAEAAEKEAKLAGVAVEQKAEEEGVTEEVTESSTADEGGETEDSPTED